MTLPAPLPPSPEADPDPGHDLSSPAGYLAELVRMRRNALPASDRIRADRIMAMIGKIHGHFAEPEVPPETERDLATIKTLVQRLLKTGAISLEDLGGGDAPAD